MDIDKKNLILTILGWTFFLFWVIFTLDNLRTGSYATNFWFCNLSIIALSMAFFKRSLRFIYLFLGMGLFFQTPWILDWIMFILFKHSFFNLSEFYSGLPLYFMVLTFIRHTLTVPLLFIVLFLFKPKKPKKKDLLLFSGIILSTMIISYLFGINYNINCANYFCSSALGGFLGGFIYWTLWTSMIILISLFSVRYIVYPLHKFLSRIKIV